MTQSITDLFPLSWYHPVNAWRIITKYNILIIYIYLSFYNRYFISCQSKAHTFIPKNYGCFLLFYGIIKMFLGIEPECLSHLREVTFCFSYLFCYQNEQETLHKANVTFLDADNFFTIYRFFHNKKKRKTRSGKEYSLKKFSKKYPDADLK